jgi:hypothetical protein
MSSNSDGLKMHTAFLRFVSLALTKDRLPGRLPDTALAAAEENCLHGSDRYDVCLLL